MLLMISFSASSAFSQIILLNEDVGAEGSYASASTEPPTSYDLDPVATYLSTEAVAINYYGQDNTSAGAYDGASGGNFFLLSNNWNVFFKLEGNRSICVKIISKKEEQNHKPFV